MENNLVSGIYMIYSKWDLIWFENKVLNKLFTIKDYELRAILLNHFDEDYSNKILEAIYKYEKVIIDFDNNIVKKVTEKDIPFLDNMKQFFSSKNISSNFNIDSRTVDINLN